MHGKNKTERTRATAPPLAVTSRSNKKSPFPLPLSHPQDHDQSNHQSTLVVIKSKCRLNKTRNCENLGPIHMSSGSVARRPRTDSNGFDDDADEEEEKETEISDTDGEKEQKKRKRRSVFGRCSVGVRKGKRRLLFQFRKLRKLFKSRGRTGSKLCCCACLSKPEVVESDAAEGNVDPDDPEQFSYEYLKSMIEKNDFYSKECDTHFDC